MNMHTMIAADQRTIPQEALDAFASAIAAIDPADAISRIDTAWVELQQIVTAESRGRARLEEIASELAKQSSDSADDLATALIAGRQLTDQTTSRAELGAERSKLQEAMASLARRRSAAQRKIDDAMMAARRPYSIEAAKLIEEVAGTARQHMAGLLACYAAAETLSRTADIRGVDRLKQTLREMLRMAQRDGVDLLASNLENLGAPGDAQQAIAILAEAGERFGIQAITQV
jgi:hypothetical protein